MTTKTPAQLADEIEGLAAKANGDNGRLYASELNDCMVDNLPEILRALRTEGQPVAWQYRHEIGVWLDCPKGAIEHLTKWGIAVRPLYTHPLPPPGELEAALDAFGQAYSLSISSAGTPFYERDLEDRELKRTEVLRLARGGVE